MSISHKFSEALMLTKVLKSKKLMTGDFPINKAFHSKGILIQCRKCEGLGTDPEGIANCPTCGGRGVEKITTKAYNKELRKQQLIVKTKPTEDKTDMAPNTP